MAPSRAIPSTSSDGQNEGSLPAYNALGIDETSLSGLNGGESAFSTMDGLNGAAAKRYDAEARPSQLHDTSANTHRSDISMAPDMANPDSKKHKRRLAPSPIFGESDGRRNSGGDMTQPGKPATTWNGTRRNSARDIMNENSVLDVSDNNDYSHNNHTGFPNQRSLNGDRKSGQPGVSPEQPLGMIFEHTQEDAPDKNLLNQKESLADPFEHSELTDPADKASSPKNQEKEKERVLKLSPEKMHELTSSPHSIPYRAVPSDSEQSRRVVSDIVRPMTSSVVAEQPQPQPLDDAKIPAADHGTKTRPGKDYSFEGPFSTATRPLTSSSSSRNRPQAPRAVSTPSSTRRQTVTNERLAHTWASRSKQDRLNTSREAESKTSLTSPQSGEPVLPSPLPPTIPQPPLSVPTYLQLELASGRPSPLYIHRTAMSDFPYESSRVKLERLMNFFMLPPALEQVLWFGTVACLDAWLYSFTILPLRFVKALYILLESWMKNLGAEFRFISGFIAQGIGRVWRRRNKTPMDRIPEPPRNAAADGRPHSASTKQDSVHTERDVKNRGTEPRRRRDTHLKHRRQKSTPSALLPDDKADILKGLLMITTCIVLMRFDASRMYHWIRGQAAIKLYVIYNVLEVSDRLLAAIGQDVLECLFSREALERRPDGRSKVFRPFGLFLLALAYTVTHATSLFYQVMTLNVAVNSYSNALITLLLSNQFVEIKSTVFKKFEKENLFQLTCADVVERFQLWLMLTIIASRNIVETGAFNFIGNLGTGFGGQASASTNSTPLSTPPRTASSILPQSFTIVPSSIIASFSQINSFLPTLAQVLGPFLVVLGSEMVVDWLKHAYINKFNNTRPAIYGRFLDILAKDYYSNAFGDPNLTRRLGLPVIPLSCLFFRVSVQTYQMFLAALLPQQPSSTAMESTSLSSIHSHYAPAPIQSPPPFTLKTILPASAAHIGNFFRQLLANAMPTPAQSVYIFTVVLLLTGFVLLLIFKVLIGMIMLALSRSRYKMMKQREAEHSSSSASANGAADSGAPRGREYTVEGSRRVGGWGVVEVNDDQRRWIYADDPESLRRLKAKEEKDKGAGKAEDWNMDHVQRYEMVAKRIW